MKKHQCDTCGKAFNLAHDLKRHVLNIHEGVKYHCDKCDKTFGYIGNLKKHVQVVHDGIKK